MNPKEMRLVVASGPTREWIDPVRFISNPSSGSTGWNLAVAGTPIFRQVVYISGPVAEQYRAVPGAVCHGIETTSDLRDAVLEHLADDTILVMAAAPADFTPVQKSESKIKKEGREGVTLELTRAPDVLLSVNEVADRYSNFTRVGFAAETDDMLENAAGKLKRKNLDFICANRVYRSRMGFGENKNTVVVLDAAGEQFSIGPAEKGQLAGDLLKYLTERLAAAPT